jgi:hypothetical protein
MGNLPLYKEHAHNMNETSLVKETKLRNCRFFSLGNQIKKSHLKKEKNLVVINEVVQHMKAPKESQANS